MQMQCISCDAGTEYLNIIQTIFVLQGLNMVIDDKHAHTPQTYTASFTVSTLCSFTV
jgi:hypothetical protein